MFEKNQKIQTDVSKHQDIGALLKTDNSSDQLQCHQSKEVFLAKYDKTNFKNSKVKKIYFLLFYLIKTVKKLQRCKKIYVTIVIYCIPTIRRLRTHNTFAFNVVLVHWLIK